MDPESQGFDEVFVTRKPPPDADPESDPHHIDALTQRAIAFCTRRHARPFFCVVAHNAVHRPELAPAALVARYAGKPEADADVNRPVLGAMIEELDHGVGRLLEALRAAGIERDTLVVFTADHGGLGASERRKPLRGAKGDLYEGGLRVPLVLRWPARIEAGQTRAQLVSGADLFPTLLAAAGCEVQTPIDGLALWPVVEDVRHLPPRDALFWHYPHYHHQGIGPCAAIRCGDLKLIEWFEASLGAPGTNGAGGFELFDLAVDPGETHNLAAARPSERDTLVRRLHEWRRDVGAQEMRLNPEYDPAAPTRLLPPTGDLPASSNP